MPLNEHWAAKLCTSSLLQGFDPTQTPFALLHRNQSNLVKLKPDCDNRETETKELEKNRYERNHVASPVRASPPYLGVCLLLR